MIFEQTHKNVTNNNIFFQIPQVGDIVTVFNRQAIVTHDFSDSNERQPFAVTFIDNQNGEGIAFKNEIKVTWKRIDNWCNCYETESITKQKAQQSFFEI